MAKALQELVLLGVLLLAYGCTTGHFNQVCILESHGALRFSGTERALLRAMYRSPSGNPNPRAP